MILRAIRLLDERPAMRERVTRALRGRARGRVPGHQLRAERAAAPARRRAPQRRRGRRRRPVDLPLPRRVAQEHPRLPGGLPGREGDPARGQLPLQPADPRRRPRGRRAERGAPAEEAQGRRPRAPAAFGLDPVSFWRCENERAQAQAVAGRARAADRRRRRARRRARCWCARCATRASWSRPRSRSAASPTGWSARRRSSSAPRCATCSPGCACCRTRTTRRAVVRALLRPPVELAPGRPRARHADRAAAQDRHGLGARRRARAAGGAARGARADRDLPAPVPAAPRARSRRCGRTCSCTA